MKKLLFLGSSIISIFTPVKALAASPTPTGGIIRISAPEKGFGTISSFISNALVLVFAVAAFIVLIMLIIGAFEWITSGGDKENVAKARNRIINALIGLVILAIAFAMTRLLAAFTGLDLGNLVIPSPDPATPSGLF